MGKRIEYIDGMRGLCMWIVVYSHVALWCVGEYAPSCLLNFMRVFFLSGFFFVSGLMAYSGKNAMGGVMNYIGKKSTTLLIPTLLCGSLYMLTHDIPLLRALLDSAKCGYWFTFTLFEIFVLYALAMKLLSRVRRVWTFVIFGLLMLGVVLLHKYYYLNPPSSWVGSLFNVTGLCGCLPYFMMGLLYKRFEPLADKWLFVNKWGVVGLMVIVGLGIVGRVPLTIYTAATTLLLFSVARRVYQNEGFAHSFVSRMLSRWGRCSIEIYFLHYFLLFSLPDTVGTYLNTCRIGSMSQCMPELIILGGTAVVVCGASVAMAFVLKQLPFVPQLLFGKDVK